MSRSTLPIPSAVSKRKATIIPWGYGLTGRCCASTRIERRKSFSTIPSLALTTAILHLQTSHSETTLRRKREPGRRCRGRKFFRRNTTRDVVAEIEAETCYSVREKIREVYYPKNASRATLSFMDSLVRL